MTGSAQAESAGEWEYDLTPYLWLPVIDGTLNYDVPPGGGGGPNFEVGPTDWLDLLNYGLLLNGTARKGRFSISSDLVILSMTSKNDGRLSSANFGPGILPIDVSLNRNSRTDLDGLTWSIAAGYTVKESERGSLDLFAGVRYFGAEAESRWSLTTAITGPADDIVLPAEGSVGADEDIWDGIVGLRGKVAFNEKWSGLYYLDVGTGSSDFTWNAIGGVAREFGWGDLIIAYRHLSYDQGSDSLINDFSFSGLAVGGRFRF